MKLKFLVGSSVLALSLVACVTNPITGRSSFQVVNNSELNQMALQEYQTTLSKSKIISNTTDAKKVKTVGMNIKNAAERYYKSIGREADLQGYNWEFNLLDDKQLNAWCMPGGKVAFYSAIMPVCKDENGVAVVMGHEVSHALAGHGNERISQAMIAQGIGAASGAGIKNEKLQQIFQVAYPIGAQAAMLKYGRNQELEADKIIKRTVIPTVPVQVEYSITDYGKTLFPILDVMCAWGYVNQTNYNVKHPTCPINEQTKQVKEYKLANLHKMFVD